MWNNFEDNLYLTIYFSSYTLISQKDKPFNICHYKTKLSKAQNVYNHVIILISQYE